MSEKKGEVLEVSSVHFILPDTSILEDIREIDHLPSIDVTERK